MYPVSYKFGNNICTNIPHVAINVKPIYWRDFKSYLKRLDRSTYHLYCGGLYLHTIYLPGNRIWKLKRNRKCWIPFPAAVLLTEKWQWKIKPFARSYNELLIISYSLFPLQLPMHKYRYLNLCEVKYLIALGFENNVSSPHFARILSD